MINFLIFLMCGYIRVSVPNEYREQAVNYLFKNKVRYRKMSLSETEGISFEILSFSVRNLRSFFVKNGISHSTSPLYGFPRLVLKYKGRSGIFVGALFFAIVVSISQRYVWYMDVTGCETVSEESVLENLSEMGFTYGTNFKKIDFDYLRNKYLATYDDLCWISINMQGTYAHVEVRELKDPTPSETTGSVNIVAAEKGKIVLVESFEGAPVVFPGDTVSEGELLISGIMTSGEDELRFERADGKVLAEVERTFKVEIPKSTEEKVYTGDEKMERNLIFFKKCVKLSGNCRISDTEYDTIIEKRQLSLFDSVFLPVFIEKKIYKPYSVNACPMTARQVEDTKKQLVSKRISEILEDAELLETVTHEYETEDAFIVFGTVRCITDIGEKREVQITG